MKKARTIIKNNLIAGAILIIPLVVIIVIFAGILKKLIAITTPITDKMIFGGPVPRSVVATIVVVLVLGVSLFIIGLVINSYLGRSFKKWLESKVYVHIPFYNTFLGVAHQLSGEEKGNYPVVEADIHGNNTRIFGLLTETLADGRCLVYAPYAPLINLGQLYIVPKENVKILDVSVKDASEIIANIGFEANKYYKG